MEFIIAAGWLAGKAGNKDCNPYYEYSRKIKEEVDEIMSVREMFEARGEIRGKINILIEDGYTDEKIIERLMNTKTNPLTREDAEKFLSLYYEKYNV